MSMSPANPDERQPRLAPSPWSLQIAVIGGIPIRLHFTFLLFLIWVFIVGQRQGAATSVFLVLAIFACVLLHELGHALTAKRFGFGTRDITLYPIGGIAMLQGRPKARQELWIALAGPMVNVVIALLLIPMSLAVHARMPVFAMGIGQGTFIDGLFAANVIIPAFNMVPAFPMDGGRVLRAVLALNMPEARATKIAGGIGQFLAIVVGIWALKEQQAILMLVAFFVFLGAGQEVSASVGFSFASGRKVREAMQTRFRTIESGATLERAAQMLIEGSQQEFPVVAGEEPIGVITRAMVAQGLASSGAGDYVAGHMQRDARRVHPDMALDKAMELFVEGDSSPLLVMEGDQLVGILTGENLSEFIMLQHARSKQSG